MIKKSFYISPALVKAFEDFHLPSKDYSPSGAAGMLLYLIADFPTKDGKSIREHLRQLAINDDIKYDSKTKCIIGKSADIARELLMDAVMNFKILKEIENKNVAKANFLHFLMQAKDKTSRD
ncbi:MAG: hypothetical protein ABFD79_02520 [Phycisphaerales bacterium]